MSLEKKLKSAFSKKTGSERATRRWSRVIDLGLSAALASLGCTGGSTTKLGGVIISEAMTNQEGKAFFTEEETGEEVEVKVVIKNTDFPVSDATVLYFDNQNSEGFLISHPVFQPQLNIAEHNSEHLYSLTPAPLQILHQSSEKEKSKQGANRYISWAQANWEHTGCMNRENMVTLMKPGALLMKKLGIVETFGFSEEKFDEGVQYIEDNLPKSTVADVYVFIPYKHGFSASTTTITALDIRPNGRCSDAEDYKYGGDSEGNYEPEVGNESKEDNSGSNENNDGITDDQCPGTLFCDYFNGTALNPSKWNIVNDSGIEVNGGWLSLPNASSVAAQNQFGNSCKDKQVNLRSASYVGSVFLGNMGLSANKDMGILACGEEEAMVDISGAENGLSLYKSGGLLSLLVNEQVTSIPCFEDISYVQLTAGLNDKVEIDYVKVRCKE